MVVSLSQEGAKVEVPEASSWDVRAAFPAFWVAPETLTLRKAESARTLILKLWPMGKLSGSLTPPPKVALPQELKASFRRLPFIHANSPEGSAACTLGKKGAFECEVPAGSFDLSLHAPGFIPVYRWNAGVEPGKATALGTIALRQGASVAGWVTTEEGALARGKAIARLAPLVAPGGGAQIAERLKRMVVEQPVDERGFFQLGGMPPGAYLLEIKHPGYAPAKVFPLDVWQGSETLLKDTVVLRRPLELEVTVQPPLDWLGRPWQAEILRAADFVATYPDEPAFSGSLSLEGRAVVRGQAPGTYKISLTDSLDNRFYSDTVVVADQEDARFDVTLSVVMVRGKVAYGKEPLSASLSFGGANGAIRALMQSDTEGAFEGILPRGGDWVVEIGAVTPALRTWAKVSAEPDKTGQAEVEIRIPGTLVFGRVVDHEGKPLAHASVDLLTKDRPLDTPADKEGQFEFRGVPEGPVMLSATYSEGGTRWTGEAAFTSAVDGQETGPIELRLQKVKPLRGFVETARGPLAGAGVMLFALRPLVPFSYSTRTELDGTFAAEVPGFSEAIQAVVSPPGHALKAYEVPLDGNAIALNPPVQGGALHVAWPFSPEEIQAQGLKPVILQNGLILPPFVLASWARGHGESYSFPGGMKVPNLAPGEYRVCMFQMDAVPEWELYRRLGEARACASGYLEAGDTLQLEIPR